MESFCLYSEPKEIYKEMLNDIFSAKKYIFLETYIYDDDIIGKKFLKALIKKAKQGVKIKLLLDAWGGTAKKPFFEALIKAGGEVRFFREIQYFIRIFSKNHERNHRKLLVIDNKISYIGSMNITESCIGWREIVLRLKGPITNGFAKSFYQSWEMFGKLTEKRLKSIIHKDFEIIQDIPSYYSRTAEAKLSKLVSLARKRIMIETPYFVPSLKVITSLSKAVKRGVKVDLLIPMKSDVRIINMVRNRYLGRLYKKGINIHYFSGKILHSKLLIIDDRFFMLGSSNIDYRSFLHQYEINFVGRDKKIIKCLKEFYKQGLANSKPFNYEEWKSRSSFWKIVEMLLALIKKYL